jgi:hypothetical protein
MYSSRLLRTYRFLISPRAIKAESTQLPRQVQSLAIVFSNQTCLHDINDIISILCTLAKTLFGSRTVVKAALNHPQPQQLTAPDPRHSRQHPKHYPTLILTQQAVVVCYF